MNWEDLLGPLILVTYVVMLMVERLRPARQFPPVKGWLAIGLVFFAVLMVLNVALPSMLPADWAARHALLNLSQWPLLAQVVVGFLLASLVDFGFHRAEHAIPVMWRWCHQVHHSAVRVDIPGSAFTSPLEMIAGVVYSVGVVVLVLGLSSGAGGIVGFLFAFFSMFQHWNVNTPQWLGYFIQRPESHCLHHEYGVHARNYSLFPPWDMLFGTFYNPSRFDGRVGFDEPASRRIVAMLMGNDVSA